MMLGTPPYPWAKVTVARVPVFVQPEPVVMVMVPLVSLPSMVTLGALQAATPGVIVVLPLVLADRICPLTLRLPLKVLLPVTVRVARVVLPDTVRVSRFEAPLTLRLPVISRLPLKDRLVRVALSPFWISPPSVGPDQC